MHAQDHHRTDCSNDAGSQTLRHSLDRLHALEDTRARYLDALAFILMRIAAADDIVRDSETRCMENILREHGHLPADQAMLVIEIARHRLAMADAGSNYAESRSLKGAMDCTTQQRIHDFLNRVAHADGILCPREYRAICQIGWELGLQDPARTNA